MSGNNDCRQWESVPVISGLSNLQICFPISTFGQVTGSGF